MAPEEPEHDHRVLTDASTIRALAHPVRLALLEVLGLEGQLTATQAGELIGESSTTCSFHLRQLAKYGFVEEAGGGKGRARPWKAVHRGLSMSSDQQDPQAEIAAGTLAGLYRDRQFARLRTWLDTRRSYPKQWREASTSTDFTMWLSPHEAGQLRDRVLAVLEEFNNDRAADPSQRPPDALPVEYMVFGFPNQPAKKETS